MSKVTGKKRKAPLQGESSTHRPSPPSLRPKTENVENKILVPVAQNSLSSDDIKTTLDSWIENFKSGELVKKTRQTLKKNIINILEGKNTELKISPGCLSSFDKFSKKNSQIIGIGEIFQNLPQIEILDASKTKFLDYTKILQNLTNLSELNISINAFKTIPDEIFNLSKLKNLNISQNNITEIPQKIEKLKELKNFNIFSNKLNRIAEEFYELKELNELDLGKNNLYSLSNNLNNLTALTSLNISRLPKLEQLPDINALTNLTSLNIFKLPKLEQLPDINALTNLTSLNIFKLPKLEQLPDINALTNLTSLNISDLPKLEKLPDINALTNLTSLTIFDLPKLEQLPDINALTNLTNLTYLSIFDLPKLEKLPDINALTNLTSLTISKLPELEQLPDINALTNLTSLNIFKLPKLEQLPDINALTNLTYLTISELPKLKQLPDINALTNLTSLTISELPKLEQLPDINALTNLKSLTISELPELEQLPNINALTNLTYLTISKLPKLEQLPDINALTNLKSLYLQHNPSVTTFPHSSIFPNLEYLFLTGTNIEFNNLPDYIRNNNITIDIRPRNEVLIQGEQSVHHIEIDNTTKAVMEYLKDNQSLLSGEEAKKEINRFKQELLAKQPKEFENNKPQCHPTPDSYEINPYIPSKRLFFYKNENNDIVKAILKTPKKPDVTYYYVSQQNKIHYAIQELEALASLDTPNFTYNPKIVFGSVTQYLQKHLEEKYPNNIQETRADLEKRIIDQLYENRRQYNLPETNKDIYLDDRQPHSLGSCASGNVNRIAQIVPLYIDVRIKPQLPSAKEYTEQFVEKTKNILQDFIKRSDLSKEAHFALENSLTLDAITPELWDIIKDNVREVLHKKYEYCSLNAENDGTLWNSNANHCSYLSLSELLDIKGKKSEEITQEAFWAQMFKTILRDDFLTPTSNIHVGEGSSSQNIIDGFEDNEFEDNEFEDNEFEDNELEFLSQFFSPDNSKPHE